EVMPGASGRERRDPCRILLEAETSLPAAFERVATAHPLRPALGAGVWQATYAELNASADRWARALLRRRSEPGDRAVALLMRHATPLIAAMLSVLKAGRIVVALNPTDPPARLRQLIQDAEPRVIFADSANHELAGAVAGPTCELWRFEPSSTEGPARNPTIETPSADTAFLIYTSGSTGRPKAVMQTHRQIVHNMVRHSRAMEFAEGDRLALLASLSGAQGVSTSWCALLNGAALCPFPTMEKGVAGLAGWMSEHGIT